MADAPDPLESIERSRLRALVDVDMDTAEWLHAADYELITPGGGRLSRAEYLGMIRTGILRYRTFEPASEVRVFRVDGAAAVRYQARIEAEFDDGTDAGTFWHTDIYALREDRWQAVWSQATRIPAPAPQARAPERPGP